jgi:hypothetical protein
MIQIGAVKVIPLDRGREAKSLLRGDSRAGTLPLPRPTRRPGGVTWTQRAPSRSLSRSLCCSVPLLLCVSAFRGWVSHENGPASAGLAGTGGILAAPPPSCLPENFAIRSPRRQHPLYQGPDAPCRSHPVRNRPSKQHRSSTSNLPQGFLGEVRASASGGGVPRGASRIERNRPRPPDAAEAPASAWLAGASRHPSPRPPRLRARRAGCGR